MKPSRWWEHTWPLGRLTVNLSIGYRPFHILRLQITRR